MIKDHGKSESRDELFEKGISNSLSYKEAFVDLKEKYPLNEKINKSIYEGLFTDLQIDRMGNIEKYALLLYISPIAYSKKKDRALCYYQIATNPKYGKSYQRSFIAYFEKKEKWCVDEIIVLDQLGENDLLLDGITTFAGTGDPVDFCE